ncbi:MULTISPECIES: hypothetical protein [Raoultella]|uniref:hypothetical protein n=1 Tax=Raoultella TaxID=160674 RepID=UPI000DA0A7B7|nr:MULTISPECIES: hypothetical protein [Raoultella]MCE9803310.1 hypothetical protein [Raoultella ornithinolytica]MCE9813723.1 hypothetical protein [Raoultella ornithinolytica]MCE9869368.1 hypothetical protein [Raoultella ornithinolytica]SPZ25273.1 Uncharacterised protein [Raoultella planticola]HAT1602500.1 hypothetical protein [Raoultella ornithinolytica]
MRMTPPHLQPVLSRVKRFVERQPEGATLTHLTHKVAAYSGLNRKDKETLIEIIRESGMLCVVDDGRSTTLHHPVAPAMTPPQPTMECKMNKQIEVTPEALRKQADALIKAAEEAEKKAGDRAEIKKQLDPLKLEILQAYGMASRKFDEFVDAMAEVGKAVQKLKDLKV